MDIPIESTDLNLDDLVRRAAAGEDVVLTRDGTPVAHLRPVEPQQKWLSLSVEERHARLAAIVATFPSAPFDGVSAARSQDFLYDENGLPA